MSLLILFPVGIVEAEGVSDGLATSSANGGSIWESSGSSNGLSPVVGDGSAIIEGSSSSSGTGASSVTGGGVLGSVGQSSGGTISLLAGLSDDDTVLTWTDSGPSGNSALKVGSPIFKEAIVNGYPVVRLAGTADGFDLTNAISGAGDWTVFFVVKVINNTLPAIAMSCGNDAAPLFFYDYNAGIPLIQGYSRVTAANWRTFGIETGWHVFIFKWPRFSALGLYVDGAIQAENAGPFAVSYTGDFKSIGYRKFDNLFYNNIDIAEILFCNQSLSDTSLQNGAKTLIDKYAITPVGGGGTGSPIDLLTLPGLQSWWKADALLTDYQDNVIGITARVISAVASASGRSSPDLINEGFEGTGAPVGWLVDAGTVDWDYTAAPLVGSQSLRLSNGGTVSYNLNNTEVWMKFRFKLEAQDSSFQYLFWFYNLGFANYVEVDINLDGTFNLYSLTGSDNANTIDGITVGQEYDCFFHWRSDGFAEFSFVEAGGVRPTSGNKYISIGDALIGELGSLSLSSIGDQINVFDSVQLAPRDAFVPNGAAIWDSVGNITGAGAASAVGEEVSIGSVGSSTGAGTANANSVRIVSATGESAGASAVLSTSVSVWDVVANATGVGAVNATVSNLSSSVGSIAGSGVASSVGALQAQTVGNAVGLSLVLAGGDDAAAAGGQALAAGSGAASANSQVIYGAAGSSVGVSTVSGNSAPVNVLDRTASSTGGATASVNASLLLAVVFFSPGAAGVSAQAMVLFIGVGYSAGEAVVEGKAQIPDAVISAIYNIRITEELVVLRIPVATPSTEVISIGILPGNPLTLKVSK